MRSAAFIISRSNRTLLFRVSSSSIHKTTTRSLTASTWAAAAQNFGRAPSSEQSEGWSSSMPSAATAAAGLAVLGGAAWASDSKWSSSSSYCEAANPHASSETTTTARKIPIMARRHLSQEHATTYKEAENNAKKISMSTNSASNAATSTKQANLQMTNSKNAERIKGVADPMTPYELYAMKQQKQEEEKAAVADPMTPYELYAMKRQQEEAKVAAAEAVAAAADAAAAAHLKALQPAAVAGPAGTALATTARQALSNAPTAPTPDETTGAVQATSAVDVDVMAGTIPLTTAEKSLEEATRKAKQHSGGLKLFSGNGNMSLALEIARHLGINLGKATVGRFADGEVNVVIHENVRGKDVYIIQPTCPPVNDNIMELLLMVSTLRRASARRITVVIPYYGYARQDRKMQARVPISAADVARLMESMGVDRVIAVDLHCGQIQGFFGPRVPVDNLDGGIVGLDYFGCKDLHNPVVVSPDAGGVYRAKKFKEGLEQKYEMHDLGLAMIVKQRARAGAVDQMDLVGDVKDCDCIIVDDMIDTAGTLCKAADVLVANGARRVFAFASHGLLSGPGNDRIANSKLEEVVILNTIPTSPQREANETLTELSVAPLLAQAIFNIHAKKSISALFK